MKYIILLLFCIIIYILTITCHKNETFNSPDVPNKKVFITFGAGNQNYYDAVNRLTSQANKINLFDTVIGYTDNDLKGDSEFWSKHSDFIASNPRGYGYWLWKPYLIMKTLETMNDGDILIYADCGCEINNKYKNDMINFFDIVNKDLIIGSIYSSPITYEYQYSKMDLMHYLNMNTDEYLNSIQRQASSICFLKCKKTYDLVKEWYEIGCNYNLIDDSPSKIPNLSGFNDHRHDQSIFSLLTKKHNIYSSHSMESIIHIWRNKSGNSALN
jgi:hypothetical protein